MDIAHFKTVLKTRGFNIGDKISSGSFATVLNCTHKDSQTVYAAKLIDRSKAPKDFLEKFLPKELEIMKEMKHENVILMKEVIRVGWFTCILMEKAEGGDLLGMITTFGSLTESDAKPIFAQLIKGLKYMHDQSIAHRDIKCENILLMKDLQVKLADLGFARYCINKETGQRQLSETYCGSAAYAAPEVLKGQPYNPLMSDVWSLGIVLYIMICGIMPFDDTDHRRLLRDQIEKRWTWHPDKKGHLSVGLRRVVKGMIEPDIMLRTTLRRLTSADWIEVYFLDNPPYKPQDLIPRDLEE